MMAHWPTIPQPIRQNFSAHSTRRNVVLNDNHPKGDMYSMKGQAALSLPGISNPPGQSEKPTRVAKKGRSRTIRQKLRRQLAACADSPEDILFLDIETTGLSHYYDEITVIGWSFGGHAKTIIKGQDPRLLQEDAARAKALVTFNGIRFDTKFIAREFPEIVLPERHVDLTYLCRRVGLTGGQKSIEKALDIGFRDDSTDMDGAAAVVLWHRYIRGDQDALQHLIRYNRADIAAMGAIFDEALSRLSVQPELFPKNVCFRDWSAPQDWQTLPHIPAPSDELMEGRVQFSDLFDTAPLPSYRIVGIDLTGSEERASGWCLLDGPQAQVAPVFSDDELIERTIQTRPRLVSIDSPLCLPAGRVSVDDNDPGRAEFGIMRECERELKRRGINVYPCLIPSMQKLTARGIRLAHTFRERGVPVIESYPGAAQDIMRIPRKGAGPEWLKAGLREFGISGEYETQNVTHDELDAITSALVGTFYLADMSEALGTDAEEPLIIPRLRNRVSPTSAPADPKTISL